MPDPQRSAEWEKRSGADGGIELLPRLKSTGESLSHGFQRQVLALGRFVEINGLKLKALSIPCAGYRRFKFVQAVTLQVGDEIRYVDTEEIHIVRRQPRTVFRSGVFSHVEADARLESKA